MILILSLILITTILVLGWTVATQHDMILYPVREWAESKKTKWKALIICVWCMPSAWGVIGYSFAALAGVINMFSWKLIFIYPVVVGGSSFLSGFLWTVYEKINIQSQHLSNIEKLSFWDVKDRKVKHQQNNKN